MIKAQTSPLFLGLWLTAAVAFSQSITENTWYGYLVDVACKERAIDRLCPVGPETERFGISSDGGIILEFDEKGNELARQAVEDLAGGTGNPKFTVRGDRNGRQLKVESVKFGKP